VLRPREKLERLLPSVLPPCSALALGEPGEGPGGWRLSHRQARAALPIAARSPERFVRYADVALAASILQDDLLATSLRQIYFAPLEGERDGGEVARETLRAYFAAGRNVSSAAVALGVNRNTVASRLRAIEARTGQPLTSRAAEFEAALRLDDLGEPSVASSAT
jgi:DNA-binding PucR family transcriptional regulator